jgi:hypothetical protein
MDYLEGRADENIKLNLGVRDITAAEGGGKLP